jgi:hypothetical protein
MLKPDCGEYISNKNSQTINMNVSAKVANAKRL